MEIPRSVGGGGHSWSTREDRKRPGRRIEGFSQAHLPPQVCEFLVDSLESHLEGMGVCVCVCVKGEVC